MAFTINVQIPCFVTRNLCVQYEQLINNPGRRLLKQFSQYVIGDEPVIGMDGPATLFGDMHRL